MNASRIVLCVVTDTLRQEYAEEFASLEGPGVELVFESSPGEALSLVGTLDPRLLIVAMDLGQIEGIEFLAMVTTKFPDFENPLVVLPAKADEMPPMIHSRNKGTKLSSVDSVDFGKIAELLGVAAAAYPAAVDKLKPAPPAQAPFDPFADVELEAPRVPAPLQIQKKPPVAASPAAETNGVPAVSAPQPVVELLPSAPKPRVKWMVPAAASAGLVAVLAVGYFVYTSAAGEPAAAPDAKLGKKSGVPAAEPAPASPPVMVEKQPNPEPVPRLQGENKNVAAAAPSEPAAPPAVEPLADEFVAPVTFERGQARPTISDPALWEAIVQALRNQPDRRIVLTGHTSILMEERISKGLGLERAISVMNMLEEQGIPEKRIKVKSAGHTQPIASNNTEEGREKNRRVTVKLVSRPGP